MQITPALEERVVQALIELGPHHAITLLQIIDLADADGLVFVSAQDLARTVQANRGALSERLAQIVRRMGALVA